MKNRVCLVKHDGDFNLNIDNNEMKKNSAQTDTYKINSDVNHFFFFFGTIVRDEWVENVLWFL